jgi:hypothetical protein
VTLVASGALVARDMALGMIAGAIAFVIWCLAGTEAVKRFGALKGSITVTGLWFVVAFSIWVVVLQ